MYAIALLLTIMVATGLFVSVRKFKSHLSD
jgi:hypothetical protein